MASRIPGGYRAGDTPLHRIDARIKLALLAACSVATFVARPGVGLAAMAVLLGVALAASSTSVSEVVRGVRPALIVLAFSLVVNTFTFGATVDLRLVGDFGLSLAGLVRGFTAVARVVIVVGFALTLSRTTVPPRVAGAAAALISPLARLGVPVGDVSMVLSVAIRFIPVCLTEVDRIVGAQRVRGVRFDQGGVVERVRRWSSVLVPLIVALFRRADDLAESMCDRCYTGQGRTQLEEALSPMDHVTLTLVLAVAIFACLI